MKRRPPLLSSVLALTLLACSQAPEEPTIATQAAAISTASNGAASEGAPVKGVPSAASARAGNDTDVPPAPPVPEPPLEAADRSGPEWARRRAEKAAAKVPEDVAQAQAPRAPAVPAKVIAAQKAFEARADEIRATLAKLPANEQESAYQDLKAAHFAKAGAQ